MSRRTWLVSVSIVGHLAVGVGLFASGVWKLEKLESDNRLAGIGVMTPTLASGGSPTALPEPNFKKKDKKVANDPHVQWDQKNVVDEKPKITSSDDQGEGLGEGPGKGIGKGPGDQDGSPDGVTCTIEPCAGGITAPPEPPKPPDPPKVVMVPPTVLQGLRISGDTQIHPSRVVQNQILADGKAKVIGTIKVCIQPSGAIASTTLISSTKYPEYDQQLLEASRRWHYRPFTVNNVAVGACSAVSFVYSIK